MKKAVFFTSLLFILACGYEFSLDKTDLIPTSQSSFIPKVYFKETDQFIDIKTLNRESRTLSLLDQIVFSNKKEFLSNTNKSVFNLEPLNKLSKSEKINIKVSSFCSHSKANLGHLKKTDKLFQELASPSFHPSISIVDLLPPDILINYLDKQFYCSFIFALRNKQEGFTYYNLTQQTIQADFSDSRINKLALVQETELGYKYAPAGYTVKRESIKDILLLNNTNQAVTNYELFCEGLKVMDIPSFQTGISSVFVRLMAVKNLPAGRKNCRFFSKNNKKITGVTRSFQLNFNSLGIKSQSIDLSQIEEPVFVDISKKNVFPRLFDTKYNKASLVGSPFRTRSSSYYFSSKNSLALNAYIYFKNLSQVSQSYGADDSIKMTIETQCFDANPSANNNFFGVSRVVSSVVKLPLREKVPIASVLPSNIFDMGQVYDRWLKRLIQLQTVIDYKALRLVKSNLKNKEKEKIAYKNYLAQIKKEKRIEKRRHQVNCLYKIKLEDKYNPKNRKEFEMKSRRILWTRDSFGVSYTAFSGGKNPFITVSQQAHFLMPEDVYYQSKMGYLSLTFFDLIGTPLLQKEDYGLERFALKCNNMRRRAKAKALELSWPYRSVINNQIVLDDLFLHPNFQEYIEAQNRATCRVLFYGKGDILRYFSGELRLSSDN